jgi:hypothetical protein
MRGLGLMELFERKGELILHTRYDVTELRHAQAAKLSVYHVAKVALLQIRHNGRQFGTVHPLLQRQMDFWSVYLSLKRVCSG